MYIYNVYKYTCWCFILFCTIIKYTKKICLCRNVVRIIKYKYFYHLNLNNFLSKDINFYETENKETENARKARRNRKIFPAGIDAVVQYVQHNSPCDADNSHETILTSVCRMAARCSLAVRDSLRTSMCCLLSENWLVSVSSFVCRPKSSVSFLDRSCFTWSIWTRETVRQLWKHGDKSFLSKQASEVLWNLFNLENSVFNRHN